jgi:hypothetical protein
LRVEAESPVKAGDEMLVSVQIVAPSGADLRAWSDSTLSLARASDGHLMAQVRFEPASVLDDALMVAKVRCLAPAIAGRHDFVVNAGGCSGPDALPLAPVRVSIDVAEPQVRLLTWDAPAEAIAGEWMSMSIGAKSSLGTRLGGLMVEVVDKAGQILAEGCLSNECLAETNGVHWATVRFRLPMARAAFADLMVRLRPDERLIPRHTTAPQFVVVRVWQPEGIPTDQTTPARGGVKGV